MSSSFEASAAFDDEEQAGRLAFCLGATYAEHVAVLTKTEYRAGGLRVRGGALNSFTQGKEPQIFILSGSVEKWKKSGDAFQHHLHARAAIILPPHFENFASQRTSFPCV